MLFDLLHTNKKNEKKILNWNVVLLYEQTSVSKLNKFLSNFLSVKNLHVDISSPKYLNKLFRFIPRNNNYLLTYIYFRKLFRIRENRKELLMIPAIISFISISVSPSILSILMPSIIFFTTTITFSKKCSLDTYNIFTPTKIQINTLIFCIFFLEFCLFAPIFYIYYSLKLRICISLDLFQ